jgi:phenylacetic acid degradation operon negative regulatory protein
VQVPHELPPPVRKLVTEFRRQRPIRGGSLLITIFGDSIAPRGGAVTLASLIDLATPFALPERLVRTAVGRLSADDWLVGRREGRASEYRLSTRGRSQFAAATARIYGPVNADWPGTWTFALIGQLTAAQRLAAREPLQWAGFGEPQTGVLAHPTIGQTATRELLADMSHRVVVFEARIDEPAERRAIVRQGWELAELEARYARFVRRFAPTRRASTGATPLAAFLLRTLLIHEYRKIHLRDPLLPPNLLPRRWSGTAAYDLCRELYSNVFAASEQHLDTAGRRFSGELPTFSADARQRFGGLPRPN